MSIAPSTASASVAARVDSAVGLKGVAPRLIGMKLVERNLRTSSVGIVYIYFQM